MLQKGFFITKSFNWSGRVLINLSGSQQFVDDDVIFPKGVYQIDVAAGATFAGTEMDTPFTNNAGVGVGGKVSTEVTIEVPFIVRAYCGSKGNYGISGTNTYSGPFKVNAWGQQSSPSAVNHIFGNAGGPILYNGQYNTLFFPGGGNCLGDGAIVVSGNVKFGLGAGSCVHFIPVDGVFGTDYLFAAHCAPAATMGYVSAPALSAGNGSVYGGAMGALGSTTGGAYPGITAWNGGDTPYGNGGQGVVVDRPPATGFDGTGVGAGKLNGTRPAKGVAAYFKDGVWATSELFGEINRDGHITVTYVRPI